MKKILLIMILFIIIVQINYIGTEGYSEVTYYIQVGVFSNLSNALGVYRTLSNKGFDVNIVTYGNLNKVYVGHFSEEEAMKVLDRVRSIGYNAKLKASSIELNSKSENLFYYIELGKFSDLNKAATTYNDARDVFYDIGIRNIDGVISVYAGEFSVLENAKLAMDNLEAEGFSVKLFHKRVVVDEEVLIESNSKIANVEFITDYFGNDYFISGLRGSYSKYIYINENWTILEDPIITLIYDKNQLDDSDKSTITITLNDKPIYSEYTQNHNKVEISIDRNELFKGFNKVSVLSYNRQSDSPCEDDLNPANWLKIEGGSSVSIIYNEKQLKPSLKDFPYPYIIKGGEDVLNCIVSLPKSPSKLEIEGLTYLSQMFGQIDKENNYDLEICDFEESDKRNNHLIVVSEKDNLPTSLKSYFTKDELANDSTIISEIISPFNADKRVLVILLGSKKSIKNAYNILSKESLTKQISSNKYIVEEDIDFIEDKTIDNVITLSDLGYAGNYVEGVFDHTLSYNFKVPVSWKMKSNPRLILNLRYSDILDFEKSLVTIFTNGIPIGSRKLSEEKINDDSIEFAVPYENINQGNIYNIDVRISLHIKDTYCQTNVSTNAWGYVKPDSALVLPYMRASDFNLSSYQGVFINDQNIADTDVYLSKSYSLSDIEMMCSLITSISQNSSRLGDFNIHLGNDFNTTSENKKIFIINTNNDEEYFTDLLEYLKILYENSSFNSNQINLLENDNIAATQLITRSTDVSGLAIAVNNNALYKWIISDLRSNNLDGDTLIINREGLRHVFYADKELEERLKANLNTDQEEIVENNEAFDIVLLFEQYYFEVVIFITLLILLIIVIMYFRKKDK